MSLEIFVLFQVLTIIVRVWLDVFCTSSWYQWWFDFRWWERDQCKPYRIFCHDFVAIFPCRSHINLIPPLWPSSPFSLFLLGAILFWNEAIVVPALDRKILHQVEKIVGKTCSRVQAQLCSWLLLMTRHQKLGPDHRPLLQWVTLKSELGSLFVCKCIIFLSQTWAKVRIIGLMFVTYDVLNFVSKGTYLL